MKNELDPHVESDDQDAASPRGTCERCAQPFAAQRADARYCSPSCRSKASRSRRGAPREPVPAAHVRTPAARAADDGIPPSVARRLAQLEATVAAQAAELREAGKAMKRIEATKPPTSAFEIMTKVERELEPLHKRIDRLTELVAAPKASTALGVRVQQVEQTGVRRRELEQLGFELHENLDREVRRLDGRIEATGEALLQLTDMLPGLER